MVKKYVQTARECIVKKDATVIVIGSLEEQFWQTG